MTSTLVSAWLLEIVGEAVLDRGRNRLVGARFTPGQRRT